MSEVRHSKYILAVLPDRTCRPVRIEPDLSVDLEVFCRKYRLPGWHLYYVSPSWIQRLPDAGVFTVGEEFTKVVPDFRLQFLPDTTPRHVLRVWPYATISGVKLAPWNIIIKEDSNVSLDMIVENFRHVFPVVSESICVEFEPNNGFETSEPIMDNRNTLKSVKVCVKVELTDQVANKAKEKVQILKEILDTEESYVNLLQLVNQNFNEDLFAGLKMNKDIYRRTFKSIGEILPTHVKFLESLREAGTEIEAAVGGVFCHYLSMFSCACPHVCNFKSANRELVELLRTNKSFANRVRMICREVFQDSQTVDGLLITPVQRIPRYPLLLKELLKATPEIHWDHDDIKAAHQQIVELVKGIDSKKREQDELNFVFQLQQEFGNRFIIAKAGRKGHVALTNVKVNDDFKASVYLFNDLLLLRRLLPEDFIEFSLVTTTVYHSKGKMLIDNRYYIQESEKTHEFAKRFQEAKRKLISDLCTFGKALSWASESCGPPNLTDAAMGSVDDDVYLFGGRVGDKVSGNVWQCRDGQWVKLQTINEPPPRYGCSMCVWGNKLVVFGGQNNMTYFNDLLVFDTTKNLWSRITSLEEPAPRSGHAAALMDTQLWIFGGRNTSFLNDLVVFDFAQSKWWHVEPGTVSVPSPRAGVKAFWSISADGKPSFSIFGGYQNDVIYNDIWAFSYGEASWIQVDVAERPSPRIGHVLVTFERSVFVIGGRDANGPAQNAYRLDLSTIPYTWSYLPQADEPHAFIAGCGCTLPGYGIALFGGESYGRSEPCLYRIRLLYTNEALDTRNKRYLRQRPGERPFSRPIYDAETKMITAAMDDPLSTYVFSLKVNAESFRQTFAYKDGQVYWRLTCVLDTDGRSSISDSSNNLLLSETSFRLISAPERPKDESEEGKPIALSEAYRKSRSQRRSQGWVQIHRDDGKSAKSKEGSKKKHHRGHDRTRATFQAIGGQPDEDVREARRQSASAIMKSGHHPGIVIQATNTYSGTTDDTTSSVQDTDDFDDGSIRVRRSLSSNPPSVSFRKERVRSRTRRPFIINFGTKQPTKAFQAFSKTSESDLTSDLEEPGRAASLETMPQLRPSPSLPRDIAMLQAPSVAPANAHVDPNDPLIDINFACAPNPIRQVS